MVDGCFLLYLPNQILITLRPYDVKKTYKHCNGNLLYIKTNVFPSEPLSK